MMRLVITALLLLFIPPVSGFAGQAVSPAPAFSLTDLRGKQISLDQFQGKVVLLTFWAPWCAPCRDELPAFEILYKKYENRGFIVVGVAEDASVEGIAAFLNKVPVSFPVVIDHSHDAAEAYRLSNLPSGYLIGRNGIIRYRHPGFARELLQEYEKEISELVKEKYILTVEETP